MRFNHLSVGILTAAASSLPLSAQARSLGPFVSLTSAFVGKHNNDAGTSTSITEAATALTEDIPSGGDSGPLSQAADLSAADAPLISDIEMLSNMLAEVVKRENPTVYDLYTRFRKHGMDRAANPDDFKSFEEMKKLAHDVSPVDNLGVMKTFSIALNLVNAAEVHHRMRLVRMAETGASHLIGPLPNVEDSVRGTMEVLLDQENVDPDKIFDKLTTQKCEIVLTAHPTEVNRKTMLLKYRKISELLAHLERSDLHPFERAEALNNLRAIIAAIWGSDEIRRVKPTVQKEAAGGNAVIESVLWDAVPSYLRKLDAQCRVTLGKKLPVDCAPIKFASWIGGDRDGNPNCTPEVTLEVATHQRLRAAKMFLHDVSIVQMISVC